MQYIIILLVIILGALLGHYMALIKTSEPIDTFPTETGYSVICYPDGKYGWIDSEGYRTQFVYDTHSEAYENMSLFIKPSKLPRDKYATWEVCE